MLWGNLKECYEKTNIWRMYSRVVAQGNVFFKSEMKDEKKQAGEE